MTFKVDAELAFKVSLRKQEHVQPVQYRTANHVQQVLRHAANVPQDTFCVTTDACHVVWDAPTVSLLTSQPASDVLTVTTKLQTLETSNDALNVSPIVIDVHQPMFVPVAPLDSYFLLIKLNVM